MTKDKAPGRQELLEMVAMEAVQRYVNSTTSVTVTEMVEAMVMLSSCALAVAEGLTKNQISIEQLQEIWTPPVKKLLTNRERKIITPDKRIET